MTLPLRAKREDVRKKDVLQAVWRKAFRDRRTLEIACTDKTEAMRLRFSLYNAVKEARQGQGQDEELKAAATECVLTIRENVLRVIPSAQDRSIDAAFAALDGEMPETEEEAAIRQSQERLLALLGQSPKPEEGR